MRDSYDAACKKIKDNANPNMQPVSGGWGARSTLSVSSKGTSRSVLPASGWGAPPTQHVSVPPQQVQQVQHDASGWGAPPAQHASVQQAQVQAADSSGWGAPPYAQPTQPPPQQQHQQQQQAWPTPGTGTRTEPTQKTYASATSGRPANHYTNAGGSVAPSFLSSTNAVPLGRRGGGGRISSRW